jgi:hypothetical protein
MSGLLDHHQPGVWHRPVKSFTDVKLYDSIVFSPDKQSRDADVW